MVDAACSGTAQHSKMIGAADCLGGRNFGAFRLFEPTGEYWTSILVTLLRDTAFERTVDYTSCNC